MRKGSLSFKLQEVKKEKYPLSLILRSHQTLIQHGVDHAHKPGDIGAGQIVAGFTVILRDIQTGPVDALHDSSQALIDLFGGPV